MDDFDKAMQPGPARNTRVDSDEFIALPKSQTTNYSNPYTQPFETYRGGRSRGNAWAPRGGGRRPYRSRPYSLHHPPPNYFNDPPAPPQDRNAANFGYVTSEGSHHQPHGQGSYQQQHYGQRSYQQPYGQGSYQQHYGQGSYQQPRGQGGNSWQNYSPQNRGGGNSWQKRGRFQRENDREMNPGGSENIRDYFKPSMVDDPWKFLRQREEIFNAEEEEILPDDEKEEKILPDDQIPPDEEILLDDSEEEEVELKKND